MGLARDAAGRVLRRAFAAEADPLEKLPQEVLSLLNPRATPTTSPLEAQNTRFCSELLHSPRSSTPTGSSAMWSSS
jgi:hypothetical protein